MKKTASEAGSNLASHKWKSKTKKEKSDYGKMMVTKREEKRQSRKLEVVSEGKEEKIAINK
jgi:hypothetical protein